MSAHLLDMEVYRETLSTPAMRAVFDEAAWFQSWLDVEAALARAQGTLGVIPAGSAEAIAAAARVERIDFAAVQAHGRETGHSLVPLLRELRRVAGEAHAGYVHWGATTQDIVDTGLMLLAARAHGLVRGQLRGLMEALLPVLEAHRGTAMAGRTHGNHALPITLGFKAAGWLDELGRQLERWEQARARVLVGSINGAVGTFAAWGERGFAVQEETCRLLGLGVPEAPWQSARDRTGELGCLIGLAAGTVFRIAQEVYLLAKTEVGELGEPFREGMIGSSTMPHKRNPVRSEWAMNLARMARGNTAVLLETMGGEHERDASRWRTEWVKLPESFLWLSGALCHVTETVAGLRVDAGRMAANAGLERGLLLSEPAMFVLAEAGLPLHAAHHKVYEAALRVYAGRGTLLEALLSDPEVAAVCDAARLGAALEVGNNLGLAEAVVDRVRARTAARLAAGE